MSRRMLLVLVLSLLIALGCEPSPRSESTRPPRDEPSPHYRNVDSSTAYVGDEQCVSCHEGATASYREHAMSRSFHSWTPDTRVEAELAEPLYHAPTGFHYAVSEHDGALYQEEYLIGADGRRLHELRRRMDFVMGSGEVARSYFTADNGYLFQLPLTWYRERGWDFSPGYELHNARFERLLPDGCIACHGSVPQSIVNVEGKYALLPPGIGCERCHGPGALHVRERSRGLPLDTTYDNTIVNPSDLPLARRLDVCEQCHVHTPLTVLREGQNAFSYRPSQRLSDHAAFFKVRGNIDIVSHADRLRQSPCYVATRDTPRPLECATCHDPHAPPPDPSSYNRTCQSCHPVGALERSLASSDAAAEHDASRDCVACHMPTVKERTVPHGTFTDHWIRVVAARGAVTTPAGEADGPIEAYYERDEVGPEAPVYRAMGEVIYATRADDARLLNTSAQALDRAIADDTTHGNALFVLGLAYRQLGRIDDAMRALDRSIRIDPNRPERLHALAKARESAGRDPAAIRDLYERALTLQPALAWIRADYAAFLETQGHPVEAEAAYRAALAERPSLDVAAFNLGTLLMGMGRLREAEAAFQEAVRLDPALGEALSPLLLVRTAGKSVTGVRVVGPPLGVFAIRPRHPRAVQLIVEGGPSGPGVRFVNVPTGGAVAIRDPDGALVRLLPVEEGAGPFWNLKTEAGAPITSGLHSVELTGRDRAGRSVVAQRFSFGVVRVAGS